MNETNPYIIKEITYKNTQIQKRICDKGLGKEKYVVFYRIKLSDTDFSTLRYAKMWVDLMRDDGRTKLKPASKREILQFEKELGSDLK